MGIWAAWTGFLVYYSILLGHERTHAHAHARTQTATTFGVFHCLGIANQYSRTCNYDLRLSDQARLSLANDVDMHAHGWGKNSRPVARDWDTFPESLIYVYSIATTSFRHNHDIDDNLVHISFFFWGGT